MQTTHRDVKKFVYAFAAGTEHPPLDRAILGGKGKGLAEMAALGLPVPPGCIVSTEACSEFKEQNHILSSTIKDQIKNGISLLERKTGKTFASDSNPLLVSVRSGARVSMPGMMDTILNLGLNDAAVIGFSQKYNNERLAYDNYRRLIMMFADIVYGISRHIFEKAFNVLMIQEDVQTESELSVAGLKEACEIFKTLFSQHAKRDFPQDPYEQLYLAVAAVFNSWDGERATLYRHINHIPDEWGTAVIIQVMVFGNKNDKSATGVGFTRDPATGENGFYGEFLPNAQGEEVVAGIRTPQPINLRQKEKTHSSLQSLEEMMPTVYNQLFETVKKLERHYKNMQDIEFTIDNGTLFMLQTRTGKRTGFAAVKIASDMLSEGLINEQDALKQIEPMQLAQLLAPIFDAKEKKKAKEHKVAKGLAAGPGAASGRAAFSSDKAVEFKQKGIRSILIRDEANPTDFPGMVAAEGILTTRGGSTSHAAVVARGMGKPCVVGCGALYINESSKTLTGNGKTIKEGDPISIDGITGDVYFEALSTSPSEIVQVLVEKSLPPEKSELYQNYEKIMTLADKMRTLKILANSDTPEDSVIASAFGAEGIGLCRTEHMFMNPERLNDVRCMFFSTSDEARKKAIAKLLPHQKNDFIGIFRAMKGKPVTIRLLDPPLHEFMPHNDDELHHLSESLSMPMAELLKMRSNLQEQNPMLGHRGCRLGISYPELTEMQTRAIIEAALLVQNEKIPVHPEIMIPLIGSKGELLHQKAIIDKTAKEVFDETDEQVSYQIGTMIELPRACLIADKIAESATFCSFGTNDLTQTTYGISRDDSAKFVPTYVEGVIHPLSNQDTLHIFEHDPFEVLDREGVGELMKIAIKRARKTRPDITLGICGEHGGEPLSVAFCHELKLNYVSCSAFRVPIARLAAAIANINKSI